MGGGGGAWRGRQGKGEGTVGGAVTVFAPLRQWGGFYDELRTTFDWYIFIFSRLCSRNDDVGNDDELCFVLRGKLDDVASIKNRVKGASHFNLTSSNMPRPSRTQSSRLLSSLSFAFFLFLALILLCPPSVSAQDKKTEYGTVIGIGTFFLSLFPVFL
jgi:hypothetical protein